MPCQLSYAATRAVALTGGGASIHDDLKALQDANPGTLPVNWASTFLALTSNGSGLALTDPKTGVTYTGGTGETIYGNDLLDFTVGGGGGDILAYFGQGDKPGGPAKVIAS